MKWKKRFRLAVLTTACWLFTSMTLLFGQVNTGGPNTANDHSKQVIGYITEWDAWKAANAGLPAQGALTQLNIDYSKYTILNYSFFGVARDGSLHSGDLRNKNIYMQGEVQQPGDIFYTDIYSSWDLYILFGELDIIQYISQDVATRAQAQGFDVQVNGPTWSNPAWGLYNKPLPLPLKKEGGAGGLLDLAHQNGVKVMASIGGWSMCKHYPEMAADPAKRARFVEDCKKLINIGFDGIDLDWEYPGFGGMNFTGTQADFANFTTLVQEIRAAIGPDKLLTSAMSADPAKLDGFEWNKLIQTMDYFNMMTYDFNGGWSDIAGHNSPLYVYDGAEAPTFNWNSTYQKLVSLGVPTNMVNMGCPFYGRGVVCQNTGALNAPTQKTNVTIQPDGPITTCADYTNWPLDVYDGTPNYFYIKQKTGLGTTNGWTRHWDNQAKVPYLTNGKYFLSYDDEESIGLKAQYILDKQLAGTIIWTVFGDLEIGGTATNFGTKLKRWSNVKSTLINKINEVFATGGTCTPDNITPYVAINDGTLQQTTNVTVGAGSKVVVDPQPETGTWKWTGPNGFSSSSREITLSNIQTGSTGTYTGTLTNAGGCTSSVSVTIHVNDGNEPEDGLRIIGYFPSWKGDATSVQYDKLTHIIYAFITPNASGDGSLGAVPNVSKLQQIVNLAHAKGVKVSIAVGGWSDLNNPGFEGLSSTAAGRENFANSLLSLCNQYSLDGVDIDWEYPIGYTSNFASMMQTLATKLHASGKLLSAAVPGGDYYGQYIDQNALNTLDFLNIMAYDGDSGAGHSPYSFAVSALNYWSGKGMPNAKAVLGVPFYSRPSSTSFADLLAQGASPNEDYYNGEYYNGIPTIKKKSELAKSYGGIMIWELTHDATGANSLLSAIYEVIHGGTASLTAKAGGPYSGKVNTAITFSGTASGGTSPYSYTWNFGDGTTGTGSSTSHTYATVGSYTVTLTVSDGAGKTATNTTTATVDDSGNGGGTCWTEWTEGAYNGGAQVSYNGVNYQAKWWTNGVPGVDDTWENMGTCDGSGSGNNSNTCWTAWIEGAYNGGAQVSYNGINYQAKWWTNGVPGADDTWENMGPCGNSGSGLEISAGNSYSGKVGVSVSFSGMASGGTSPYTYTWNFGDGSTGTGSYPGHAYSSAGAYTASLTVKDAASLTATSQATVSITNDNNNGGGELPNRIMSGYWHTWNAGVPFIRLRDVDPHWDVINIAFTEPVSAGSSDGNMKFEISGLTADYTINDFKTDVKDLQSKGKKIVLSIGGYEGYFSLGSSAAVSNFVTDIKGFIDEYGFDGIDIDLEQSSVEFNSGADPDFTNPVSPKVVNFIQALKQITNAYGSDFILSFAPETFYFQMGHTYYGGLNGYVDTRSGVYIPIIYALRDKVTYVQAQLYNSGSIQGLDGNWYDMGTIAGIVEMCEMAIEGFTLNSNASHVFPGLRPDQVVIGVPCSQGAAGSGQVSNANLQQAFTTLAQQYPGLRGFMTWSINWDALQNNNSFAIENRTFLDGYKNVKALPSDPEQTSTDITLYPIPAENTLMIKGLSDLSHIAIYDMVGQKIIEATSQPVDVSGLKTGTYILKVSSENKNIQKIFIKN